MIKQWRRDALLLPALALILAGGLSAQSNGQVTGSADLGWRSYFERPNAQQMAKFEEYRDMRPGPFLQNLQLEFLPGEKQLTSWELGAQNVARRDQTFFAKLGRVGLFDLRLGWDQIPHTYSTDGQIIAGAGTSTPFTLPSSLTRTLADTTAWKTSSQFLDPIRSQWSVGRAALTLTPGEFNDVKVEYTRIGKSGDRPMGMPFGSPGANQREILEPVDQTTNDVRVSESYARRNYQLQFSYDLNTFHNASPSVTAANPLLGANSATAGSANGRSALAPSNLAHTFSAAGGVSLPLRVRVNGALSYSLRRQNEAFIPMTINSAITDSRQSIMPASLEGDIRTLTGNLTATAHPARDLTVTARYRLFKYDDKTPDITAADMPIEIVNDRSITVLDPDEVARDPMPYKRQSGGLDVGWRPSELANVKAGVAWERWDRYNAPIGPRNVRQNDQYTPRLTLDLTPTSWALLRGSISHSRRRGTQYEEDMDRVQLRRFDEADKDANRGDLMLQLTPNDRVNVGLNYSRAYENYLPDDSAANPYGVRADDNTILGADVGWTPTPRLNVFASYTREVYNLQQHSRYGEPSLPDDPTYDWLAYNREWVETYGVGANATLVAKKLDLEFRYDRSNGISALHSMNPQTPAGGTASQNANATAVNFPDITHSWNPIRIAVRYQLNPNWSGTLGYDFENFQNNDFRTNGVLPPYWAGTARSVDPVGDVILGNDLRPYRASYLTFSIGFRPGLRKTTGPVLSVAQ